MSWSSLASMAGGIDKSRQKNKETQDALNMLILKAKIEQMVDPMYQLRMKMLEGGGVPGFGGQPQQPTQQPGRQVATTMGRPVGFNQTIQGSQAPQTQNNQSMEQWMTNPNFLLTGKGDVLIENPEWKSELETQQKKQQEIDKPLPAESALRYSGALQGIRDIKKIKDILGLTDTGVKNLGKAKNLIYKTNLSIEATGADRGIPFLTGAYRGAKMARAGDVGSRTANLFMTLAENLLRARTGAAAPEPEIVREYARSLLKGFIESPETWISKLKQNEEFLLGTAQNMRPHTWEKDLKGYKSTIFNESNNNVSPKNEQRVGKYTYSVGE